MFALGLILLLIAMSSVVTATPERLPAVLMGFYWIASLIGQSFALPLFILSLAITAVAKGTAAVSFALLALMFAVAHWRNRRAGRILLDAAGLDDLRIPWLTGLLPFATGGGKVIRTKDLSYGPAGERNLLDVVRPKVQPPSPMPVLIHVHGGAWVSGAKNQQGKALLHHAASQGWLGIDINYRLGPTHRCADMIADVLRAIAWVRNHAADYGGDPEHIVITGGSAGGHLAALAALAHDDPTFKPGFETADCSVAGAIPLYGRYDFLDRKMRLGRNHHAVVSGFMAKKVMPGNPDICAALWRAVSPLERIRCDAPPMIIVHGSGDTMLPHGDAADFAQALRALSRNPVAYVELPGIQHGWDNFSSALTWAHVRAVVEVASNMKSAAV